MKIFKLLLVSSLLVLAGCTSGSKPITVVLSPSTPQAIDNGQSVSITVSVANDPKNGGATLSLTGPGTLTNSTATGATYVAPTTGAGGTATVTATSVSLPSATSSVTITVTPPPGITTTTLPAGTEGTAYSQSVKASGGAGSMTYTISTGSLPAGLTLSSSGNITGTPTGPNTTSNFTVKVTDSSTAGAQSATQALIIAINLPPAPSISTTTLPAGTEGTAYSQTVAETGGLTPFTYSVSVGSLPAGLAINSSTGAITGTPTGPNGTASFTVKVTDSSNPVQTASQPLSIAVNLPPAPSITTASLPAVVEGATYNQAVTATGYAPLAYSISSGALPAGLALNSGTGAITGTPTGPNGTASFTVKVTDKSNPPQTASQPLSILVNLPPAPSITTTTLPAGTEFVSYNQTVQATGYAPLAYSISVGALPAGLTLNSSTGAITGSPTGPNSTVNFTAKVTDNSNPSQSTTQNLSIVINLPTAPSITTASLPNGTVSTPYNQTIGVTGGHAPFVWSVSVGTLPAGLSLNPASGAISGSPTTQGTYNFTIKAVDSSNPAQSASQAYTVSVVLGPLAVTPATLPTGAVNDVYPSSTNLAATGGLPPYSWSISAGALPGGLALSTAGQITGTPTASGTFNFTAKVTDSTSATSTGNFSIIVNPALAVTTTSLPGGTVGTPYSSTALAASGGVTPYSWSVTAGALPGGISLNSGGTLSGQPTASGTFNFTVQVADSSGGTSSKGLSIVVNPAPPLAVSTTSGQLPTGTINVGYPSTNLSATGGVQPYTWSITVGALPTGMSLSTGGQITGTPTVSGTYNFTAQVQDSTSATASASLSITVNIVTTTCDTTLTGKESLLLGDYAFTLSGFDASGNPAFVGGVFTASGTAGAGNITVGTVDMNLNAGVTSGLSLMAGSQYNLGQDTTGGFRGCMALVTSSGTQNYAFSVDAIGAVTANVASDGHMIDFDTTGPFTAGILRQATSSAFSTASIIGNWTFGISGPKPSSSGGKFSAAGVLTFASGNVSGVADSNDSGKLDSNSALTNFPTAGAGITLGSGPYSINSNGRGAMTFYPGGGTSNPVDSFVYVVSASEVLVMSSDVQTGNSPYIGRAFKQSGSFSTSSLTGNHVAYHSGVSTVTTGGSRVEFDLVSTPGTPSANSFTYNGYQNDAGSLADPTTNSASGTFTIASNGRVTLNCSACGNHLPIIYLFSANTGFFLNADGSASFGGFEAQTGSSFTNSSLSGNYGIGTIHPEVSGVSLQDGDVNFAPGGPTVTGIFDNNAQGTLTPDSVLSPAQSYSVSSTGFATIPSGCSFTGGTCKVLLVIISPTKAVAMDANPSSSSTTPRLEVLQQ